MDLIEGVLKKFGFVREQKNSGETKKTKLNVVKKERICVPIHAQKKSSKKNKTKTKPIEEESPFDRIRSEYEKDKKEFSRAVNQIMEQQPSEPFDYDPELGVESVGESVSGEKTTSPFVKKLLKKNTKIRTSLGGKKKSSDRRVEENLAESSEEYVPRFSSTARQKLGLEEKVSKSDSFAEFEVSGVYVGAETIVSGIVLSGKLTKKMTAQLGKTTIKISDLKIGVTSVDEISGGVEGTIFTKGLIGLIKYGDIIEFS